MFRTYNKVIITNKLNLIQKYLLSVRKQVIIAKGDSGATNHCWRKEDIDFLQMIQHSICLEVTLLDNSVIKSDQQGHLPISQKLSPEAQQGIVLPHLKSSSLASLCQLCDDNCKFYLTRRNYMR